MLHVNKCARVLMKNGLDRLVHMKTYCCPKWWKEFTVEILMTCTRIRKINFLISQWR